MANKLRFLLFLFLSTLYFNLSGQIDDKLFTWHIVDPNKKELAFYLNDQNEEKISSIGRLKELLESQDKKLVFAMNGGMYMENQEPLGLFIENGRVKHKINTTKSAYGNFYLQPNGVFYLNKDGSAGICQTDDFSANDVSFATQSGPLLLIDKEIHPAFRKGSKNLHIRNAVGILPDGRILFAMSKERINFYDFASFFLDQDCSYALYLDGFVSRTFLPEKTALIKVDNLE